MMIADNSNVTTLTAKTSFDTKYVRSSCSKVTVITYQLNLYLHIYIQVFTLPVYIIKHNNNSNIYLFKETLVLKFD